MMGHSGKPAHTLLVLFCSSARLLGGLTGGGAGAVDAGQCCAHLTLSFLFICPFASTPTLQDVCLVKQGCQTVRELPILKTAGSWMEAACTAVVAFSNEQPFGVS